MWKRLHKAMALNFKSKPSFVVLQHLCTSVSLKATCFSMAAASTPIDINSEDETSSADSQDTRYRDRCPSRTPKRDRKRGIHWSNFPKYDDPTPKKPGVSEEAKEVKPPVLPILENED